MSTKPIHVDKNTRTATFDNETFTHEVTLYKKKKEGSKFEDKVYRLSLHPSNKPEKVLGRIGLNLSDHIRVDPVSKRIAAPLNNGSRVILSFSSTFLHEAKGRKKGSKGSSGSALEEDNFSMTSADDTADLNDLADLDLADMEEIDAPAPSPVPAPIQSRAPPNATVSRRPAPISQEESTVPVSVPLSTLPQNSRQLLGHPVQGPNAGRRPSVPSPGRESIRKGRSDDMALGPQVSSSGSAGRSGSGSGGGVLGRAPVFGRSRNRSDADGSDGDDLSKAELERLRKENRNLRRKNDDLQSRLSELEKKLDAYQDVDYEQTIEDLSADNRELKAYADDLETKLRREPVYSDVVRDLREAKMALAILTLEKDELLQEVRRLRK